MNLARLVELLGLHLAAGRIDPERIVSGGYASDLLSDVIANSKEGNIWVTLQQHQNIVAVASLRDLAGIILVNGRQPDHDTREKADKESIPILVSELPAFELIGKLHELGIHGSLHAPQQEVTGKPKEEG